MIRLRRIALERHRGLRRYGPADGSYEGSRGSDLEMRVLDAREAVIVEGPAPGRSAP